MINFGPVLTAMITPFKADGSVDYETAAKLADHLAHHGTDTLVICGTTGESPTLTWEEEYELFRVIKGAAGSAKVMAGTGSNSTQEAIYATTKATELGLDGSLQVVPYYNKPPQEGLYAHFKAIAEACPTTPLMLYNIPGRTGQNMTPETIGRLAELPTIVAIKEASGSLDQVSQVRQLTPPEFGIYSGDDSLTLPILAVGGCGVVSVASHLVGPQIQAMIQAYQTGKPAIATQIHLELLPLFKALFMMANPIPIKAALSLLGWPDAHLRLPLIDPPDSVSDELRPVLQALKLLP